MSVVKNPTKIYVGNIPRYVDEKNIEDMFAEFGKLISLEFKGDFAFIEYDDGKEAELAIKKLDGVRLSGRRLVVEPFRYRGNDPRYRRPPPKNIKRGEFRVIVTNLGPDTTAQNLRDWCENEKLETVTVADVYSRHDNSRNEGVIEFRSREDFDYCLKNLDNVKFGDHVVHVFDERDYNRRKLKAHERDRTYDNTVGHKRRRSRSPPTHASHRVHNYNGDDNGSVDNDGDHSRSPSQNRNTENKNSNRSNRDNKERNQNTSSNKHDSSREHQRNQNNNKQNKHRHNDSNSRSRSRSASHSQSRSRSRHNQKRHK